MNALPAELLKHTIKFVPSEYRSRVCTVCKLFNTISVSVSKEYSVAPFLYEKDYDMSKLQDSIVKQILLQGDYHLIVRLKHKQLINILFACEGGHLDIVTLMIEKGAESNINWNSGLYDACKGGHLNIVKLMIEKGANNWNKGLEGTLY